MVRGKSSFLGHPEKWGGGLAVSAGLTRSMYKHSPPHPAPSVHKHRTITALLLSMCFLLRYNIPAGKKDRLHSFIGLSAFFYTVAYYSMACPNQTILQSLGFSIFEWFVSI